MSEITLPLAATSAPQKAVCRTCPKRKLRKKKSPINAEKKKLVLGVLHSISHTGSLQDESYIHSYFIPGRNNKSSKHKFKPKHNNNKNNSRHNTINSKHNQHQYLYFTYLQLRRVRTGVFSFADHFSRKFLNDEVTSVCLIHCYDTQQQVSEPIFIFCGHSVISDSLWSQVVWLTLVTSS